MDERALFDRFHDALDIEPRSGAYERMRHALTSNAVALRTARPPFQMRFSKMGLRTAAALTAAALAIALIAAFLAAHNHPTGSVPAQTGHNVAAYRAMITADYKAMDASTSNHCGTIDDSGCAAAIQTVNAALQKWVNDLEAFANTPTQFAALDTALRAHLKVVISDQNAAIAFQKSGNAAGFTLAMQHAFYQRAWVDPASFTIEGTYQTVATSFRDAIARAKVVVVGCLGNAPGPDTLPCNHLANYDTCEGARAVACEGYVEGVETQIESFLIGMAQNPAPPTSAADYAQLQADLAKADAGLLAIHDALLGNDSAQVNSAETAFLAPLEAADRDLATI